MLREVPMFKPIKACGWLKSLFDPKVARIVFADLMHYFFVAGVIAAAWPFFSTESHFGVRIVLRAVVLTSIAGACVVASALLAPRTVKRPGGAAGSVDPEASPKDSPDDHAAHRS
jgi:hypothetical protein